MTEGTLNVIMFTLFTRISTAVLIKISTPQMRRLFDGGVYLKVRLDKNYFNYGIIIFRINFLQN